MPSVRRTVFYSPVSKTSKPVSNRSAVRYLVVPKQTIFELGQIDRRTVAQAPATAPAIDDRPDNLRRDTALGFPEGSDLDTVRHITRLSQTNFSIETHFYPLGVCTMKHNPRVGNTLTLLPDFLGRHPLAPMAGAMGFKANLNESKIVFPIGWSDGDRGGTATCHVQHTRMPNVVGSGSPGKQNGSARVSRPMGTHDCVSVP